MLHPAFLVIFGFVHMMIISQGGWPLSLYWAAVHAFLAWEERKDRNNRV